MESVYHHPPGPLPWHLRDELFCLLLPAVCPWGDAGATRTWAPREGPRIRRLPDLQCALTAAPRSVFD